jgi:Fe-Mn family superoxide dismutase
MPFVCPELPFAPDALKEKGISQETIEYHYGKHHKGYVTKLNTLTEGKPELQSQSYEQLILTQQGAIFNCAAQTWNHTFYWNCLAANGGGPATGALAEAINAKWGSFDKFKEEFTAKATNHFGSGWVWLVRNADGSLDIVDTHDAGCPLTNKQTPILTIDVWEHAYYIDFRNDRVKYIATWWGLVNWEFANSNISA